MSQVDVLIITALKEEYEAARDAGLRGYADNSGIAAWEDRDPRTPTTYIIGNYVAAGGAYMSVALARPTRMGSTATSSLVSSLVERLKPRCLAMCGVCAGNPADVALGDVIVAELAYAYDEGKRTEEDFEGDHRQIPLSDVWVRSAQDLSLADLPSYGEASEDEAKIWLLERLNAKEDPRAHPGRARYFPRNTWNEYILSLEKDGFLTRHDAKLSLTQKGRSFVQRALYDDVHGPEQLPFKVVVGPIASGNVVVKDGRTWKQLKQWGVRTAVGLEMEAAMIASTAHRLGVANWVVAKGVMDYADPRKDDRYKGFAARASAEVLFKLLTLHIIPAKSPHALIRRYSDWTMISPETAFFSTMQIDPFNPSSVVYAGMSGGQGIYRSSDGGRYWESMKRGLGDRKIRNIAVSSFDASLYVATDAGLWVSNDHGLTWREHPDFEHKSLLSVALSPHDPNLLLVGCQRPGGASVSGATGAVVGSSLKSREGVEGNGLKISPDKGASWTTLSNPENINGLWIDPEDSRMFAVVSTEDGVFFSRDGLEKLRRLEAFPKGQEPLCFAMLHGDPDRLLVGTLHGGLYWSDDDGVRWQRGAGIPDVQVSDIKFLAATCPFTGSQCDVGAGGCLSF
jgi:nucleoside phosphorylase